VEDEEEPSSSLIEKLDQSSVTKFMLTDRQKEEEMESKKFLINSAAASKI
jgi:hypothetical protein